MFNASVDAYGEGRLIGIGIAIHHEGQIEFIETVSLHGETDQASGLRCHEVDRLWCGELGRTNQVTFIFTLLVVHDDHAGSIANGHECFRNAVELNRFVGGSRRTGVQEPGKSK